MPGLQSFSGGYVGVDVFFVISGYLITKIILAEREAGIFTLARFYERRARRILPALYVTMLACMPFAWLWLLPTDMESFSQSMVAVSAFSSNVLFWWQSGYFEPAAELKPLLHTWSLAVEEQYYLLFPVLLILMLRLGKRWTITLLAGYRTAQPGRGTVGLMVDPTADVLPAADAHLGTADRCAGGVPFFNRQQARPEYPDRRGRQRDRIVAARLRGTSRSTKRRRRRASTR